MKPYLILQYPYSHIEIALCRNGKIIKEVRESKFKSIELTIPHIQEILSSENLTVHDISFIAVNTGPGPYNTLRSLITTANGIHFVQKTPLIDACALDLLLSESDDNNTIAILNAFSNHIFYALKNGTKIEHGYCSVENLTHKINQQTEPIKLIGNGAIIYKEIIRKNCEDNAIFPAAIPDFNSLKTLAEFAYAQYSNKRIDLSYLMPKYLQSPAIK